MVSHLALLMHILGILFIAASVPSTLAVNPKIHHAPKNIPPAWKKLSHALDSASIEFTFVLAGNYTSLTQRMEQIASSHLSWLTESELASYVGPSKASKNAVQSAIEEMSATVLSTSAVGDKVTVKTSVGDASKAF